MLGHCCRTFALLKKRRNNNNLTNETDLSYQRSKDDAERLCDDNDDYQIPQCPLVHDVLIRVFNYLPLSDLKNVRRTCKLWNESCSTPSITNGKKLVLRANCSVPEIAHLLCNLSFQQINLEFQDQPIFSIPAHIWKTCGSKVRGLHFHRCRLDQQILKVIIEYCVNLCDINIHESESPLDGPTLDYFIEKEMKRENLSSFAMCYANDESISIDLLRKIFVVFPRIESFTTGNAAATPLPNSSGETVPQESVLRLQNLVYLHNNYSDGVHWLQAPMIPVWKLRLKKFETTLNYSTHCLDSWKETFFQFFDTQKNLEIVSFRRVSGSKLSSTSKDWALFIKELIFCVLERCPNLREFRLFDLCDVCLTEEETASFFASIAKLESLVIRKCCFWIQLPSASLGRLAINTLRVENDGCGAEEFKICILGKCSLKHLRIGKLTDEIFQEILKTQPDLRTLVLDDIQSLTSLHGTYHTFTGRDRGYRLSIKQLKRLEYFGINERYYNKFTKKAANEFQFPFLKHLKLDMHSYNMPEKLSHIKSNIPLLEVLELNTLVLCSWNEIIGLCSQLKNLRHLSVHNVKRLEPKELSRLFQKCPNLRHVSHVSSDEVFLLNPFTGKISISSLTNVKFPKMKDIFDG